MPTATVFSVKSEPLPVDATGIMGTYAFNLTFDPIGGRKFPMSS